MPDPSLLTPLGQAMLAQLPPAVRGSIDYMAVIHAYAKEIETVEAAIEQVRAQFNPMTADTLLPAWEVEVRLPVGGLPGQTLEQRRAAVVGRLSKPFSGQGRDWERAITAMVGPGWSYLEHDPANPSSPAPGVIQVTIPWASGTGQFTGLVTQIRDITDAHLQVEVLSSAPFLLDESQMDVSQFGD